MSMDNQDDLNNPSKSPLPISRVADILRNLNVLPFPSPSQVREGLMAEEDLALLENGYSVSESELENDGALSLNSASHRSLYSPDAHDMHKYLLKSNLKYQNDNEEARAIHQEEKSILQMALANEKAKFLQKQGKLERVMDQLRNDKKQQQITMETQKQNFAYQLLQQKQQAQAQIDHLKERQGQLNGELPRFKDQIEAYKMELNKEGALLVSEEAYVDIKGKPDSDRSLKEVVQVKVYEALEKYQREIEILRRENDELLNEGNQLKVKEDRESREIQSLKRMMGERENEYRRKLDEMDLKNTKLETELNRVSAQYKVLLEKGNNAKELDERNRALEVECRELKYELYKVQDTRTTLDKDLEHVRRQLDLVNQDKSFLGKENMVLEERNKRLEEKLERVEQEMSDAKKQAQKYMDKVLNTNDEVKNKFEGQYQKEMQDLKDRHQKELELAKNNLVEVYEKKVEYLQERKDDGERRVAKLEQDFRDKSKSYEELMFEYRQLQRQGDEELGHLKLQVKSRADELMRVTHLYEDNMVLVKELKLENEAFKQKIELLKTEYYKLESVGRQGSADIKAELAVCKERLANYELIEKELDQAIMNVANNDRIDDDGPMSDVGNALIQTITSAPTTAKRRIQQSLLLANRLQGKQKEVEELQREIKDLKEKIGNQESEGKLQKRLLEKTNQPYSYMIADIEKSEKELSFAHKKIKQLEEITKKFKSENEQLKLQKKGLHDDLQTLIQKREDIELLQTTLQGIIQHSSNKKIDVDELKSKLAESLKYKSRRGCCNGKGTNGGSPYKNRDLSRSKSRSPRAYFDEVPERGVDTVKMYNKEPEQAPAWYKTLKKHIGK